MKAAPLVAALLLVAASPAPGQSPSGGSPSGEEVVSKVEGNFAGIADYTVTIDVTVDMERLTVPPMHATMYFKQPDKVHVASDAFIMLPREATGLNFAALHQRFSIDRQTGRDTARGGTKITVGLTPRKDRTGLRKVLLYVDPVRWTADRFVAPVQGGRIVTATVEYLRQEDRWLPSLLTLSFQTAQADSDDAAQGDLRPATPGRQPLAARKGTVTIRYSDYRINTGLSDELFRRDTDSPGSQ